MCKKHRGPCLGERKEEGATKKGEEENKGKEERKGRKERKES